MNERNAMLGNENINKLLFKLSAPAMVGMMVMGLYNLVDTFFVGQAVGKYAIAALAVAFPIQMIVSALAQLVGLGTASVISRNLGAQNPEKATHAAGISFVLVAFIGVFSCAIGLAFMTPILKLFSASGQVLAYAKDYMFIIFLGNIFVAFTMSSNNIIRSEGNAKKSMVVMLVGTVINIILDPIFISLLGMGIKGAALATIIAQGISSLFILMYFIRGKSTLHFKPHHFILKLDYVKEIFIVGLPSFARQVSGSFLAIIVNNSLVYYGGDIALSAYGLINKVTMFMFMPLFGVIQGMQPIVGFNYGAEKYDRVKKVIKSSVIATTAMLLFGWTFIQFFPNLIFNIFLPVEGNQDVYDIGIPGIRLLLLAIPIVSIQIVGSSVFQALGKAKPAFILSLLRQIILLVPLLLIMPKLFGLGLMGIWISYPISDVLSTIIGAAMMRHEFSLMSAHQAKEIL